MCGSMLAPGIETGPVCASFVCRKRHADLPEAQKCGNCGHPLQVSQYVSGVCGAAACASATRQRPLAAAALAAREQLEQAAILRDTVGEAQRVPLAVRVRYPLAVLPINVNRTTVLPTARRRAFEATLRQNLAEARARLARGESCPRPRATHRPGEEAGLPPAEQAARAKLVVAACTACRGACCLSAGDHAFNSPVTMMRYLREHPRVDDEQIVHRYLAAMPERTVSNGCVFQGDTGCTLQPALRADVCGTFYCSEVQVLFSAHVPGDPVRAFMVHASDDGLVIGKFVDVATAPDGAADGAIADGRRFD